MKLVLAINPGSTSTKIGVFLESRQVFIRNIKHTAEDLAGFKHIYDQLDFRYSLIMDELKEGDFSFKDIKLVIGRGGLIKPVKSGIIEVNQALKNDLINSPIGEHASNLGGLLSDKIAREIGHCKAYIVDPVVVDELEEVARITGLPFIQRKSIFHPLNQKAVGRLHAKSISKHYEELNLIIAHMGGGITIGAHQKGKVIDVNNGLDGEGPLTPERTGTLPNGALVDLCFSGKYTRNEIKKLINGKGGYMAWFGINNAYQLQKMAEAGDEKARIVQDALAYQVAKDIGAMSTVLKGDIDAILLTGGLAYSEYIVDYISKRVQHLAKVYVYPGEDEMQALAQNGFLVLNGLAQIIEYE